MNNNTQQFDVAKTAPKTAPKTSPKTAPNTPRPVRAEWERSIASLRPWLSAEKFQEAEKIHWRMFDRANSWFESGSVTARRENSR